MRLCPAPGNATGNKSTPSPQFEQPYREKGALLGIVQTQLHRLRTVVIIGQPLSMRRHPGYSGYTRGLWHDYLTAFCLLTLPWGWHEISLCTFQNIGCQAHNISPSIRYSI